MSWFVILSSAVVLLYTVAAVLEMTALTRAKSAHLSDRAQWPLYAGMFLHCISIGELILRLGVSSLFQIQYVFSAFALLIGVGFVVVRHMYDLRSIATLVVPLMVLCKATAALSLASGSAEPSVLNTLLVVHISSALLASASFVLAAVAGVLYLVQERNLKAKQFGPLFHKLPSIGVLDRVSLRLILFGFPVYTLAITLGAIWAWKSDATLHLRTQYVFAVISWLIYAIILHARLTAGWRGRRAALLSIASLTGIGGVLAAYLARAMFS